MVWIGTDILGLSAFLAEETTMALCPYSTFFLGYNSPYILQFCIVKVYLILNTHTHTSLFVFEFTFHPSPICSSSDTL